MVREFLFMLQLYYVCVTFCTVTLFYPNHLSKENRREFDWKRANPIGAIKRLKKYPAIDRHWYACHILALCWFACCAQQLEFLYYVPIQLG
jgi:NAD-dependent dihydropyrimidine dehydrogenase PreA subunit